MFQEFYKHLSDPEDSDPEDTAFHGGDLMAFMVSMRQKSIVPNVAEVACYETGTKTSKTHRPSPQTRIISLVTKSEQRLRSIQHWCSRCSLAIKCGSTTILLRWGPPRRCRFKSEPLAPLQNRKHAVGPRATRMKLRSATCRLMVASVVEKQLAARRNSHECDFCF